MARSPRNTQAAFTRVSALADVAVQGRFGAGTGQAGVSFTVRHPLSIATVIARKGKAKMVADALDKLKGVTVLWAGPEQYFVQAEGGAEGALAVELMALLKGMASVSDQSHSRVVIRIEGPKARNVLAKGSPVDLHPEVFPVGQSALTQMAHVGVHMTRAGEHSYDLSVFRGFSESFFEWLTEQAEEYGYLVR